MTKPWNSSLNRSDPEQIRAWRRRSKGLKRSGSINPVNQERRAKEWRRAYGSEERVQAIKQMECVVPGCRSPSDNAHIETEGMGRKADWTKVVNLCRDHHRKLDDELGSVARFDEKYGVDLTVEAARLAEKVPA